jgi:DNA-directed RNA polymerase subunit M/transcription elongation factor TFIIS
MPEAYNRPEPTLQPSARPRCPECQNRMMLARIAPGPNGSHVRTFECPKCEQVQEMLIDYRLKSANNGRTAGGA